MCKWVKERVRENNDWIEGTQYIGTLTMNLNQSKTDRLFFLLLLTMIPKIFQNNRGITLTMILIGIKYF